MVRFAAVARALVTGGAGFIGSHVAERLLAEGYEVAVVDDLSTGRRANIPDQAVFHHIDITNRQLLESLVHAFSPNVICHLAAQASVTVSVQEPDLDLEVNVRGTLNVCRSAAAVGSPVIFASTGGALYGDGAPLPTPEDFPPHPVAPYGASKQAAEAYVGAWGRLHELPNAVLRLGERLRSPPEPTRRGWCGRDLQRPPPEARAADRFRLRTGNT